MNEITITSDPNQKVIFHPINDDEKSIDEKQKVAEHVGEHYRKYLFGVGALFGLMFSLVARIVFGTNFTVNQISAADATTDIAYESLSPEVKALIIFNQMDAIAHEKDNFFHQTGKIYTLTGDTLFRKYDTIFHILDNAYHGASTTQEKLKRAKRLENFINMQNEIFAATEYINPEQDRLYEKLHQEFKQMLLQIPVDVVSPEQTLTEQMEDFRQNELIR